MDATGHMVVLVVEDEPLVRMLAVECLRDEGFTVYEAASAAEALVVISDHGELDVLFSDVDMPGMNGLDLAREVARRWPHVGCLLTSGGARPEASWSTPSRHFLSKPYGVGQLGAWIRAAA